MDVVRVCTYDIVEIAGKYDSLDLETSRGDLSNKSITDRPNSQVIDDGVDKQHRSERPSSTVVLTGDNTKTADDQEQAEEADVSPDVKWAATNALHQEPGDDRAAEAERILSDVEVECALLAETCLTVDLNRVTHQSCTTEGLSEPDNAGNSCTAELDALEAVEITNTGMHGFLEIVGVLNHGNLVVWVEVKALDLRSALNQ